VCTQTQTHASLFKAKFLGKAEFENLTFKALPLPFIFPFYFCTQWKGPRWPFFSAEAFPKLVGVSARELLKQN